jgi:hypothetical protein
MKPFPVVEYAQRAATFNPGKERRASMGKTGEGCWDEIHAGDDEQTP